MPKPKKRARSKKLFSLKFGTIILIAMPIVVVASLAVNAIEGMYRYYDINNDMTIGGSIKRVAALTYNAPQIIGNGFLVALDRHDPPEVSPLTTLRLEVVAGSIEEMASNLPTSAKAKYYRGELLYPDGESRTVRYRFRGRSPWHWHPEKPSLRLRLSRENPLWGQRDINLTNPEDRLMISNVIGDELASRLGLLSFGAKFARLFVNGKFYGVYQMTFNEDESFLRVQGRMPGPLFVGSNLQDPWTTENFEVEGDTAVLDVRDPMSQMVEAIYAPLTAEKFDRLWSVLSFDAYARWMAVVNLTASTHTDTFHNHLYYFDAHRGLLEPAIVDSAGHGLFHYVLGRAQFRQGFEPDATIPLNEPREPLKDAALRDPRLYHARNVALFDAIEGVASSDEQSAYLDRTFEAIDPDVYADRNKAGARATFAGHYRIPYSNSQYEKEKELLHRWIEEREQFIRHQLSDTEIDVSVADRGADTDVLIAVEGHAATRLDLAKTELGVVADTRFDGTFARRLSMPQVLYPGLREDSGALHQFVNIYRIPDHLLQPARQYYLLRFENASPADARQALASAFSNAVTHARITPTFTDVPAIDANAIPYNKVSFHAWNFAEVIENEIVLGPGDVALRESLFVEKGQSIRIVSGSELRLDEGVSIVVHGRLTMNGTAEEPIRIRRLNERAPWGAISITGSGANGSRLTHVDIEGGSVAREGLAVISGMLSVVGVDDFSLTDSRVAANVGGDDLIHTVYGSVTLDNVTLEKCFADCLDIDYSSAAINDLRVTRAGNDGIDFMTSRATLADIEISGAGDKGISVGEGSTISIEGVEVTDAIDGLAVKDRSRVRLSNAYFGSNITAINVFSKNWRYGGAGELEGSDIDFGDSEVSLSVEDSGSVTLLGQKLPDRRFGDGIVVSR